MEIKTEYKKVLFDTKELEFGDYQISIDEQQANILSDIERLKSELQESDYKVVKCAEAICLNAALPYNMTALHNERQALRDKINELEKAVGAAKGKFH